MLVCMSVYGSVCMHVYVFASTCVYMRVCVSVYTSVWGAGGCMHLTGAPFFRGQAKSCHLVNSF